MDHSPPPMFSPPPPAEVPGRGLAIASFVIALIGLIVPGLGLIGLILGIIAMVQSSRAGKTHGLAIAGTCISGAALLVSCLSIGILLPALGKARQAARQIKSSSQLRAIHEALVLYANDNKDWYPESSDDWQDRLTRMGLVSKELLTAPDAEPGQVSYFYVPGQKSAFDGQKVILFENPALGHNRGRGGSVAFDDNHVDYLTGPDFFRRVTPLKDSHGQPLISTPTSAPVGAP